MTIKDRNTRVYVPAWQGLSLRSLIARPDGDLSPFPFQAPHRTAFHTARSAIYHLFTKLVASGRTKVLTPDYHCQCTVPLFSELGGQPLGSFGDYAVFCLYKTLPVIDGGLLVQNRDPFVELDHLPLRRIGRSFEVGQAAELWMEGFRSRAPRLGATLSAAKRGVGAVVDLLDVERVPVGDVGFNPDHASFAMSTWSDYILGRLEYSAIRPQRRRNFTVLAEQLAASGIAPWLELKPGVCPLFYPLLVKDKSSAARALRTRGVMATELWNEGDPMSAWYEGAGAKFLRRHVLELPIHQDIRKDQLQYIARQVVDLQIALEPRSWQAQQAEDRDAYAGRISNSTLSVAASS